MSNISLPEDLEQVDQLINEAQIEQALKTLAKFEDQASFQSLRGNVDKALAVQQKCMEFYEKIGIKNLIARSYRNLGGTYLQKGDFDKGSEYGMKSLQLWEEENNKQGIAAGLCFMGNVYNYKGKLDLAIDFNKQSLSIQEILPITRVTALYQLGVTYYWKGELHQSIKYCKKSLELAESQKITHLITLNLNQLGVAYQYLGENETAIAFLDRGLELAEKIEFTLIIGMSLITLILLYVSIGSLPQAQGYLKRLQIISEQKKTSQYLKHTYMASKALILKLSGRSRDRAEAESLLKGVIEDNISNPVIYLAALMTYLTFLLEELRLSNSLEVLDELNPLLTRFQNITEKTHSYMFLATSKIFEAKLALIQLEFDKAKRLLTEAQHVAELRGFLLIAQMISTEHDLLLRQQNMWDEIKKTEAPIAERIELASFDAFTDQMRGIRAVDPPELVNEEPILLLIMDDSGIPYFNHSFESDWDTEGIFSSFMSAFNTWSSELFSKSIDRIRIGENTILINPVEPFLACYVIKGQSYPALQKLTRFTETIRQNSEIWEALNKSVKTSEMLELDKPPALKTVINEIFT